MVDVYYPRSNLYFVAFYIAEEGMSSLRGTEYGTAQESEG